MTHHTFFCYRCKRATPHELSEDWKRARCLDCEHKKQNQQKSLNFEDHYSSPEGRHWSALDGTGNRGEGPPPECMRKRKAAAAAETKKGREAA